MDAANRCAPFSIDAQSKCTDNGSFSFAISVTERIVSQLNAVPPVDSHSYIPI
jgi:hypothetical protein